MANHKRKRAKHQRAGCLICKPHKDNRRGKRVNRGTMQQRREDSRYEEMMQRSHRYLDMGTRY